MGQCHAGNGLAGLDKHNMFLSFAECNSRLGGFLVQGDIRNKPPLPPGQAFLGNSHCPSGGPS